MSDELVRELRHNPTRGFNLATKLFDRAADRIESLSRELAEARELLREAANSMDAWDRIHGWTRPRWTARLRAFLAALPAQEPKT